MKRWLAQNWFLLGLLGAVGLAFVLPGPGAPGGILRPAVTTKAAVALIFFGQGLMLALGTLHEGLWRWRLHVLVQGFTYVLIPLLGLGLDVVFGRWLPDDLRLGFLFLAVLPTTISSAVVFTSLAGGNTAGALVNATLSNLLGVVITPLWVSVLLQVRGEAAPWWPMVRELALLVLLPLVLGQFARLVVRRWVDAWRMHLTRGNSVLVLYIVYAAFCGSVQTGVWTGYGWRPAALALAGAIVLFGVVCILTVLAVRIARLPAEDRVAALFCAPQKTLAAGAPMAKLIFATHPGLGLILLPVMIYHPLQLIVSGALVNVLKKEDPMARRPAIPLKRDHARATMALRRRLGARVLTDDDARFRASFDGLKLSFLPDAVIAVRGERDIGVVLELANRHGVPVTVRGGGSSLTGSAAPIHGGWVLDVTKLDAVVVHADEGLAEVGVGATITAVQNAAEAAGWFYPPDPSSRDYSTIGGNIACNAGGMHGAKYGVTRDFVLGLRGFLPTGEKVKWGGRFKKFACGYNLRDLWIGSEGTLGVITSAVLRLVPKPETKWTLVAAFSDEAAALAAVQSLIGRRILPSILEFLDRHSVQCAERATGRSLFPEQPGRPLLLVELDGAAGDVAATQNRVLEWASAHALASAAARTQEEAERLWEVRRKCSPAMFELGDAKLNEDVVVPMSRQVDFAHFLDDLQRSSRLPIATFGHAADGNFHVNIMSHRDNAAEQKRAHRAVERLMRKVVALGGTISGEHGIGLAKTPFLRIDRSAAEVGAMLAIKRALDPRGILNPGKIFQPFEVWNHRPLNIRLAWDHK